MMGRPTATRTLGTDFVCNSSCSGEAPRCGDGTTDNADGEVSDAGDANTDSYGVSAECNTTCSGVPPNCGDGIVNGPETCDEGVLNSDTWSLFERCNTECNGRARIVVMALSMAMSRVTMVS